MSHKVKSRISKKARTIYADASVRSGSREDHILRILNSAVDSIDNKDRFVKHMQLLAGGVVFTENPLLAFRLLHIYRFCEHAVKHDKPAEALRLIKRLRIIVMMLAKSS